jgi:hypothetical protein
MKNISPFAAAFKMMHEVKEEIDRAKKEKRVPPPLIGGAIQYVIYRCRWIRYKSHQWDVVLLAVKDDRKFSFYSSLIQEYIQ